MRGISDIRIDRLRAYARQRLELCEPLRWSVMATVRSAATQEIETLQAVLAILDGDTL